MANKKIYTIIKTHRGRTHEHTGTLEELTNAFSYTLQCGHSWNSKIPTQPKTIKSLMSALSKSVHETQGSCYDQDSYRLKEE
jgi:hypothetical protein